MTIRPSILGIVLMLAGSGLSAQFAPPQLPATTQHPLVPSHGNNLLGVFYLAAGTQPHPSAVLFHGFPGFEQNLDLAQAIRRAGWNVLAVHYRGSWGVAGTFSFLHCVEDADAAVSFVLDPNNLTRYRTDPNRIVVIGHSMGGFMAVSASAHNPRVKAGVLLSAWNIGAPRPNEEEEAQALARGENLAPIAGTNAETLAHEEFTHRSDLDMVHFAPMVAPRSVLIVTAHDGSDQFATPFASALRSAGDTQVNIVHFETDHSYSDKRLELADAVLAFLKTE